MLSKMPVPSRIAVYASALLALAWGALAFAGPIGSLEVDGEARIQVSGNGSYVNARGTHTIFAGDRIETRSGTARLMLRDGSIIRLGPQSDLLVGNGIGSMTSVELIRGRASVESVSETLSVSQPDGSSTSVSAGESLEFDVRVDLNEEQSGDDEDERPVRPAPRPRSIS